MSSTVRPGGFGGSLISIGQNPASHFYQYGLMENPRYMKMQRQRW